MYIIWLTEEKVAPGRLVTKLTDTLPGARLRLTIWKKKHFTVIVFCCVLKIICLRNYTIDTDLNRIWYKRSGGLSPPNRCFGTLSNMSYSLVHTRLYEKSGHKGRKLTQMSSLPSCKSGEAMSMFSGPSTCVNVSEGDSSTAKDYSRKINVHLQLMKSLNLKKIHTLSKQN